MFYQLERDPAPHLGGRKVVAKSGRLQGIAECPECLVIKSIG
jgi:hypothetical protein